MAAWSTTQTRDLLDEIGKYYDLIADTFGDGSGSTSISGRFSDQLEALLATEHGASIEKGLVNALNFMEDAMIASESTRAKNGPLKAFKEVCLFAKAMIGGANINAGLVALSLKVHPYTAKVFAKNSLAIDAANVFPLQTALGTLTRGAAAFTYVKGVDIDTTEYAPSQLAIKAHTGRTIGGADVVCTLTCVRADGTEDTMSATMPANSAAGTQVSVGNSGNVYVSVTDVDATGGTELDVIDITNVLLRDLPE